MSECMIPECENETKEPICPSCSDLMPVQERLIIEIRERMRALCHCEMQDQEKGIEVEKYAHHLARMEAEFQLYAEGRLKSLLSRSKG